MEPEVKQRRVALRAVSRRSAQISESIAARDDAVRGAVQAGATIEEVSDAAGLEVPVVERILRDRSDSTAPDTA